MVAKGHDIPNVTLVGILSADSTLNLPDFRASERTFALLTQAAGRAGRGDRAGHVVLQTYDPDNPVIKLAATQDYDTFAASELEIRQELGYPPYTEILKITVLDKEECVAAVWPSGSLIFCRRCSWNILNRNCWYWGRSLLLLPRYVTCTA